MAVIKNISPDTRSLFRSDAPPVFPGDEVTVSDETFVQYAWPSDTWEVIEAPVLEGYVDASPDDATLFVAAEDVPVDLGAMTKAELVEHAAAVGVDLAGTTTKAEIVAAIESTEG